jgi:hypothetical protein
MYVFPDLLAVDITLLYRVQAPNYQLFGDVESRANLFRERLLIIQQRLLRLEWITLKGLKPKGNQATSEVSVLLQCLVIILRLNSIFRRFLRLNRF